MANFSTAFGYNVYLVPLASTAVDTDFTGVTSAATFMDTSTPYAAGVVVSYASGVFSVGSTPVALNMDGADDPFRLSGLTDASLETDTSNATVVTYDDSTQGFDVSLPTSKSWSVSLSGVTDFRDAGYHVLRLAEQNAVADALRVKILRIGPTGTDEALYGYGTLSGYSESIEASSIASWECTLQGYGPYRIDPDFNTVDPA